MTDSAWPEHSRLRLTNPSTLQALRIVITRKLANRTRGTASAALPADTTASGPLLALCHNSEVDTTHCPYFGETQLLVVGDIVVVRDVVKVAAVVEVLIVVALEVEADVEVGRGVVEPGEPLPEQPTRLAEIATSSYQNVLVAEP